MIDNIALTEYLPINTGYQDAPIRLTAVIAALTDSDGSETLGVTIAAIPTGATLTDGINSFTATDSTHIVAVTGWNLANLSITAPTGFTGQFALTVAATSMETATGEISNLAVTLPVTVVPDSSGQKTEDGGQTTAIRPVEGQELAEGRVTAVRADPVEAHGVTRANSATITVRSDPSQPQASGIAPHVCI